MTFFLSSPLSSLPAELAYLALAILLLGVQIVIQSSLLTRDMGSDYNSGPRDEPRRLGVVAGRAERALRNFLETFAAFAALALATTVAGKANDWSAGGAALYFWARVAYVPLYLAGIRHLRSLAFIASFVGLVIMFWQLVS